MADGNQTAPTRPEWVKCVRRETGDGPKATWCGRRIMSCEFVFVSTDHAVENGARQGRLMACAQCGAAIIAALQAGTVDPAQEIDEEEADAE